ncbi:hypothetical protein ACFPM0_26450 [Pseudonocardia sulfidoxydans]
MHSIERMHRFPGRSASLIHTVVARPEGSPSLPPLNVAAQHTRAA